MYLTQNFFSQTFINSSALLVSLMALQILHCRPKQFFQPCFFFKPKLSETCILMISFFLTFSLSLNFHELCTTLVHYLCF